MRIITRREWGGPATIGSAMRTRPVGLVVVHHTAGRALSADATLEREASQMRAWHTQHVGQGWAGIGYSFVGFPSGRIYEGRGYGRVGAHAPGANSSSLGFSFAMDSRKDMLTMALLSAFHEWREASIVAGELTRVHLVQPHRKYVPGTDCPGPGIMALLPELGRPLPSPTAAPIAPIGTRPTLRRGDRNEHVRELQRRLGMPDRYRTGFFGPLTIAAVQSFQRATGLVADAIVGPRTWGALLAR